ncbi:MAG TPA: hypothetical protein VMG12_41555, partial [Polyangiaceae bacterium]|nr:hypothetical protein [Polyangiaceae bacterium]
MSKRPAVEGPSKEAAAPAGVEARGSDAEPTSLRDPLRNGVDASAPETVASVPGPGSTKGSKAKARKSGGLSIERRF